MTARREQVYLFERTVGGQFRAPVSIGGLSDPVIRDRVSDETFAKVIGGTGHARFRRRNF